MAKKVRVQMTSAGVKALLSGAEMQSAMLDVAKSRVPDSPGYEARPGRTGGNRTRAFIAAVDWDSYNDNSRNATLLKSIGGS